MKLLIPIEIKSGKDLPEKEGTYYIQTKDFIVKGNIDQDYFNPKNNLKKRNWLNLVKFWYKEVSEEEYLKEKQKGNYEKAIKYLNESQKINSLTKFVVERIIKIATNQ